MTHVEWVDHYINTQISGKTPGDKLKKSFTVHAFRSWLRGEGYPSWAQASMMLQAHKFAQRWGTTEYMLRCTGKGPDARWVVSNWEDTSASVETKIDSLSREHVTDLLCRAKRFAEGNSSVGGSFDGDATTLTNLKREVELVIGSWNFMRSSIYKLKPIDAVKSWNNKYVVTT